MGRRAVALLALTILVSAATLAAQSAPTAFPEWMRDLLPKTAEEKARAAAFDSQGSRLLELDVFMVSTGGCGFFVDPRLEPRLYSEFIADVACGFDAIVVAAPNPTSSRLNNRGTFIFTEHFMPVDRWVFPASAPANSVEVLVAGGTLTVGSQRTGVSIGQELQVGRRYLFFLKRVAGTHAFAVAGTPLHQDMSWNYRQPMHPIPEELVKNEIPFDRFIDDLAIAAGNCRKKR